MRSNSYALKVFLFFPTTLQRHPARYSTHFLLCYDVFHRKTLHFLEISKMNSFRITFSYIRKHMRRTTFHYTGHLL